MGLSDSIDLLGFATTPLELLAFVLALITVWLNIRQIHWGWLFAIVSSVLYGVVFFDARLYGDMGLQVLFAAVSVWGWYQWLRGGPRHGELAMSVLDGRGWMWTVAGWLSGFAALAWFLAHYTDTDVPLADGFLTAGSVAGQLLLSRKKIENWHVWIVVDVLYVGLYVYKHLMLTAVLYAVFVVMAIAGLIAWRRELAK